MTKKIWQKYQNYKNKKNNSNLEQKVFKLNNESTPEQNLLMHVFSNGQIPISKEKYYPSQTREILKDIFDQDKKLIDLSKDSPLYNKIMLEFGENGSHQEQSRIYAKLKKLLSFLPISNFETEIALRNELESILYNTNIPIKKRIMMIENLFASIDADSCQDYLSQ